MHIGLATVGQLCVDMQIKGYGGLWSWLMVPQHCLRGGEKDRPGMISCNEKRQNSPPLSHIHLTSLPEQTHSFYLGPAPRTALGSLSVLHAAQGDVSGE